MKKSQIDDLRSGNGFPDRACYEKTTRSKLLKRGIGYAHYFKATEKSENHTFLVNSLLGYPHLRK